MHHASRSSLSLSGYPLPESVHLLPRDISGAAQLFPSVAAIGEALDGPLPPMGRKRFALVGDLRGGSERIASASWQSAYPAPIVAGVTDAEGR